MWRPLLILGLFLAGCIDPLPVDEHGGEPGLVVDGMITDQPGPYTVRLSWSSALTGSQDQPRMERGATLWISDDEGLSVQLYETLPGVYMTDASAIRGQAGRKYTLRIITEAGTEYQSAEEPLMPAGEIEKVYTVFRENSINRNDPTQPQHSLTFYVDGAADSLYREGLTRWRSTGIYEVLTFPELRTTLDSGVVVPDPLPCSGHVNENDVLVKTGECYCCSCWVYEYNHDVIVSQNRFITNEFHGVAVYTIPVDKWRFFQKYYLEVEQMSVSENVYEFWKRISAQHQGTGSLFQPNAVKIEGNIRCISEPGREVFGVFAASAIVRASTFVSRAQISQRIPLYDTITFDCRYVFENASNTRPPFW